MKKISLISLLCYHPRAHAAPDWQETCVGVFVGLFVGAGMMHAAHADSGKAAITEQEGLLHRAQTINKDHFNTSPSILQTTLCSELYNSVVLESTKQRLVQERIKVAGLLQEIQAVGTRSVAAEYTSKYEIQRKSLQDEMHRLSEYVHHLGSLVATFEAFEEKCSKPVGYIRMLNQKSSDTFGPMLSLVAASGEQKVDLTPHINALHARSVFQGLSTHNHSLVACVHAIDEILGRYQVALRILVGTSCNHEDLRREQEATQQRMKELQTLRTTITQLPAYLQEKDRHLQELATLRAEDLAKAHNLAVARNLENEAARHAKERAEAEARTAEAARRIAAATTEAARMADNRHHRVCNETMEQQRHALDTAQQKIENKERVIATKNATIAEKERQLKEAGVNLQEALNRLDNANRGNDYMRNISLPELQAKLNEVQALVAEYKKCNSNILPWIEQVHEKVTRIGDERAEAEGFPNAEFRSMKRKLEKMRDTLRATPAKETDIKR